MNITKIHVTKLDNATTLALATITFDDMFVITGLRIIKGSKGLFISFPSRKTNTGEYKDICYPITKEAREDITDTVLAKYYETEQPHVDVPTPNEAQKNYNPIDVDTDSLPF
jgi:stage V sporulation protein G